MSDNGRQTQEIPRVTIDWYRSAPWWRLASQSVGIAWRGSHLALSMIGLLATYVLTSLGFWLFQPDLIEGPIAWTVPANRVPAMAPFHRELPEVLRAMTTSEPETSETFPWFPWSSDSFLSVWRRYATYPYQAIEHLSLRRFAYALWCTLSVVAIWSFVGGCLARRSVQELGTRVNAPWWETIALVRTRWLSIAWATLMPLGLIALCCLIPLLLGWISNLPAIGPWIAGILMVPVVVLSLGIGWCAAVSLIGYPLSTAAIVSEKKADAFDGISRSAAYAFQRPLTLILSVIAAEWIGHFASGVVSIVANTGYLIVERAFSLGSFWTLGAMGTFPSSIFEGFVPWVVTAFGFSFFWTASAAIYLLIRRDVDHAEYDLIDMDSPTAPQPLPPLPEPPSTSQGEVESEPAT